MFSFGIKSSFASSNLKNLSSDVNLTTELVKNSVEQSAYLTKELNYLYKFWKEAFAFTKDGELPDRQ